MTQSKCMLSWENKRLQALILTIQIQVGAWLASVGATVLGMILLGGYTRLSRSGLSMTNWTVFGTFPPKNSQEWDAQFDKYKLSPQFKVVNNNISLEEFKNIWYVEWLHRSVGRALAPVFMIPLIYFSLRGYIRRRLWLSCLALFGIGGTQGLIGWWMVKSGLVQKTKQLDKTPRVSPYRLSVHAGFAYGIYSILLWNAMNLIRPIQEKVVTAENLKGILKCRKFLLRWSKLYAIALISGFFMAGTVSGKICNTFPKFGQYWSIRAQHFRDDVPFWKNFTQNKVVVHFNHRTFASFMYIYALASVSFLLKRNILPRTVTRALTAWIFCSSLQVMIGIITVWKSVPIELGSLHQFGALAVLSTMLLAIHSTRLPSIKFISSMMQRMQRQQPQKFTQFSKMLGKNFK